VLLKAIFDHLKGHPGEYLLILILMFCIGWVGSSVADGYVQEKVKLVVIEEVAPIKVQVTSVSADIATIQDGLNDLISRSLKRELVEIRTLLCFTPGDRRLLQNFEDTQDRYQELTGYRYEPPGCDVLRKTS
jgi:hypothetical protein